MNDFEAGYIIGCSDGRDQGLSAGYGAGYTDGRSEYNELYDENAELETQLQDLRSEYEDLAREAADFEVQADKVPDLEREVSETEQDNSRLEGALDSANDELSHLAPMADKYVDITDYLKDQYPDVFADLILQNMLVD